MSDETRVDCLLTGYSDKTLLEESPCVGGGQHSPMPSGYTAREEWWFAMRKTHKLTHCPKCAYGILFTPYAVGAGRGRAG